MNKQWLTPVIGIVTAVTVGSMWWAGQTPEVTIRRYPTETTNIGVPFDVERAMMDGAHKNDQYVPQRENTHSEASPNLDMNDRQKMNLDSDQILRQLNVK